MSGDVSPEVVERMVRLVRDVAVNGDYEQREKARALIAILPKPVDPDLLEARRLVATSRDPGLSADMRANILKGEEDDSPIWGMPVVLAAIKRGRELTNKEIGRQLASEIRS